MAKDYSIYRAVGYQHCYRYDYTLQSKYSW